jgi:hypothetical protein
MEHMPAFDFSKKCLYSRGAARQHDIVYLSLKDRKLARRSVLHSRLIAIFSGKWAPLIDVEWATAGMCFVSKPHEKLVVVSPEGHVYTYIGGKATTESIRPKPFELRGCSAISGEAYACGMKRQVYRRVAEGRWVSIAAPVGDGKRVSGFEAIAGFSDADIYAVGWEGEIWQHQQNKWVERSSPVNVILTGVCCAEDKSVYVCGQDGTLLKGRNERWEVLDQPDLEDDLWDICWFGNKLYAASMSTLYELKGSRLVPVNFGKELPRSCYKLTAADGVLWSVGQESVFSFDGKKWTQWD